MVLVGGLKACTVVYELVPELWGCSGCRCSRLLPSVRALYVFFKALLGLLLDSWRQRDRLSLVRF